MITDLCSGNCGERNLIANDVCFLVICCGIVWQTPETVVTQCGATDPMLDGITAKRDDLGRDVWYAPRDMEHGTDEEAGGVRIPVQYAGGSSHTDA
ncbi:hypothetical protein BSP109_02170 [Brevibacterium sp. Mu109]|nr:hypothetical protein BSP109_02170 [Brevibacterium sp. Mu109]